MKEYLLGTLSDAEARTIEEVYFTNQAFFCHLRRAEAKLINDYLDGSLAPLERQQFERRYLCTPILRNLVKDTEKQRIYLKIIAARACIPARAYLAEAPSKWARKLRRKKENSGHSCQY